MRVFVERGMNPIAERFPDIIKFNPLVKKRLANDICNCIAMPMACPAV